MILCLETSGKACSVAIGNEGALVATKEAEGEWKHSKIITLLVQDCLKEAGISQGELTAVAVSQGPGSYTGLRVGASCAKGLCYALDLPLISVPTLELIAYPHRLGSHRTVPMIDARRMEVYYNIYDKDLISHQETTNLIIDQESTANLGSGLLFCGDGAHKMEAYLREGWQVVPSYAEAKYMIHLSYVKYINGNFEDLAYYVPFYLKPPNITKSKKSLF